MIKKYKILIIYSVSDAEQKQALENELEKYGLERVGTQEIFALPLEEYRTKVQAFKAYLRAYSRKHLDSQDTVLFVESRMNEDRTLTTMLQTDLIRDNE
jgi:CRISPR/Cas system-associated endoribonuclease Cas2